jgi:predicted nuclease of predicted toxin-antitoxin system
MRFLVDECLHISLIPLAHSAGHACDHVNFLGLGGQKDWQLMDKIRDGDYTFVTNNGCDFTSLYSHEQLHAGLVIIIPNVTPSRRQLFQAALEHIGTRDLRNGIVEVEFAEQRIICREYSYPELS